MKNEEAIKILDHYYNGYFGYKFDDVIVAHQMAIEALKNERPHGKWIESDVPESILSKCSVCGFNCGAYTFNFCPNCGADMREVEE